jgi:hypothetical protein
LQRHKTSRKWIYTKSASAAAKQQHRHGRSQRRAVVAAAIQLHVHSRLSVIASAIVPGSSIAADFSKRRDACAVAAGWAFHTTVTASRLASGSRMEASFSPHGRVIPQFAAKAYVQVKIVFIDFCTTVYLFLRLLLHPKVAFMLNCNLTPRHPGRLKEGNA